MLDEATRSRLNAMSDTELESGLIGPFGEDKAREARAILARRKAAGEAELQRTSLGIASRQNLIAICSLAVSVLALLVLLWRLLNLRRNAVLPDQRQGVSS